MKKYRSHLILFKKMGRRIYEIWGCCKWSFAEFDPSVDITLI
jgi:hypothetical protein